MNGVDELDDALKATEAELERLRTAVREGHEALAGERLAALQKELEQTLVAIADAEQTNASLQNRILAAREKAAEMRERIGAADDQG
ncbi:MAG: hypothetical protein IT380_10990 [Myxococcales bacterium]|nr:hypothetical protein [Myxococcales bacterium]